jgi:CheY-like chemotaxis protein
MASAALKNRILIVSDEADTRMFLTNLLLAVNQEPIGAASRDQGLALARDRRTRAIILDVMMADREGIRMYRYLKADPDLCRIPVIMLSAIDRETLFICEKYQPAGASAGVPEPEGYIKKPPEADELLDHLNRLLCGCGLPQWTTSGPTPSIDGKHG